MIPITVCTRGPFFLDFGTPSVIMLMEESPKPTGLGASVEAPKSLSPPPSLLPLLPPPSLPPQSSQARAGLMKTGAVMKMDMAAKAPTVRPIATKATRTTLFTTAKDESLWPQECLFITLSKKSHWRHCRSK